MCFESIRIIKGDFLGVAEFGGDGVPCDAWDGGVRVWDYDAVLDVEALDFGQHASGGTIRGEELCDDGELGVCVDGHARAVERGVSHAVGVEIASVGVGGAAVAGVGVGTSAAVACAHCLLGVVASVGCVGSGDAIGFPDVHFGTTGTMIADAGIHAV